eukprot:7288775-Alexandrium_andersonii.AAC.1
MPTWVKFGTLEEFAKLHVAVGWETLRRLNWISKPESPPETQITPNSNSTMANPCADIPFESAQDHATT